MALKRNLNSFQIDLKTFSHPAFFYLKINFYQNVINLSVHLVQGKRDW